jgi:hypothetical protein
MANDGEGLAEFPATLIGNNERRRKFMGLCVEASPAFKVREPLGARPTIASVGLSMTEEGNLHHPDAFRNDCFPSLGLRTKRSRPFRRPLRSRVMRAYFLTL